MTLSKARTRTRRLFAPLLTFALLAASSPSIHAHAAPHASAGTPTIGASERTAQSGLARLPLRFEANRGQTDAAVRFVARGLGYGIFLTPEEIVFKLGGAERPSAWTAGRIPFAGASRGIEDTRSVTGSVLRMRLAGADPRTRITGTERMEGTANYFTGSDRSAWRTAVPTYARVVYERPYPGIDLVLYGNEGEVEYDFVVAPGADPSRIALDFEGADRLTIDVNGDLVISLATGELRQRRPGVYQMENGVRRPIDARYVLRSATRVGFEIGSYDTARPLVIDPVLSYSTYLGGSGDESGAGVAVDATGNAFIAGGTTSVDFPTTAGALSEANNGLSDGFVAKVSPDGTSLVYASYLGGTGDEGIARITVDTTGNAYLTGGTGSANFPTTAGAFRTTFVGGSFDGFAAKLNPQGTQLLYSTYLGGTGDEAGTGIAVDTTGNAYVTGATTSSNYPTTPGAFDTNNNNFLGIPDAFVTKLNATGTALSYSTYLGALFNLDAGTGIAVDSAGNAYVAGVTNGGFSTTVGAFDRTFNGGTADAFVAKLNTTGTALVYSTYLGGSLEDLLFGIAIDGSGNAYVTGFTDSTNFPVANAFQGTNAGGFDAFVTKVNATGSQLTWSSYLGGSGNEGLSTNGGTELQIAGAIAVDASGNAHVTGFTDSIDFPTVAPFQPSLAGAFDAFVVRVNASGSATPFATYLGGTAEERGLGIAVDASGNAYVTGFTLSSDLPTTAGVVQTAPPAIGVSSGFLAKVGALPGDTVGAYVPQTGVWFVRTSNTPGIASQVFSFGPGGAGFVALPGDWDGNSTVTAGVYDPATSTFFLKNSNAPGAADLFFTFGLGNLGYVPLAGDWDGDGVDTIGLYDPATGVVFLKNSNSPGAADLTFTYGPGGAGFAPLTGDWNGDGIDTIGLYSPSTGAFFLRNSNSPGPADLTFFYGGGNQGLVPLSGDWNADSVDTIGLYDPSLGAWFLRNTNAGGAADLTFFYGPQNVVPTTGHWGG